MASPPTEDLEAFLRRQDPADLVAVRAACRHWLQAEVLERPGRYGESAPVRRELFECSLSVLDFRRWTEHLPEVARPDAVARAREVARVHEDATAAAALLLELGEAAAVESRLVAESSRIDGGDCLTVVPLAEALRANDCLRAETAVLRALLTNILDRAYARAYGHAAL